jgi:hypothetical protein
MKRLDYRAEAQSVREVATHTKDSKVREQLIFIASLYEKLAGFSEHATQLTPQLAVDRGTGSADDV